MKMLTELEAGRQKIAVKSAMAAAEASYVLSGGPPSTDEMLTVLAIALCASAMSHGVPLSEVQDNIAGIWEQGLAARAKVG